MVKLIIKYKNKEEGIKLRIKDFGQTDYIYIYIYRCICMLNNIF
jgi:hypothetical protein